MRNTWQLDPSLIKIHNPEWNSVMGDILAKLQVYITLINMFVLYLFHFVVLLLLIKFV